VINIDILYLIDQLEMLLSEGVRIPLTTKVVVDEEECLNIIDQLRVSIPAEIKKAKRIQQQSQKLVIQGQEEADRIVSLARDRAHRLLDEEDLQLQAEEKVQAIVDSAVEEAEQIREGANQYALEVLTELDERLVAMQGTLQNGISTLERRRRLLDQAAAPSGNSETSE
jgi:F0F1-type ATP synthase membrane subunit b/b'